MVGTIQKKYSRNKDVVSRQKVKSEKRKQTIALSTGIYSVLVGRYFAVIPFC